MTEKKVYAYVGSWRSTAGKQFGIGIYEYDEASGSLKYIETAIGSTLVGIMHIDTKTNVLYCANEVPNHSELREGGGGGGQVLALKIDPQTGGLTLLSRLPSYGANPSYVVTSADSKFMLATNYGTKGVSLTKTVKDAFGKHHVVVEHDESNVVLFPLEPNGAVGEPSDIFKLHGDGPRDFQMSPHAHSIQRSPSGELYAVCDKGGDQVFMFKIDAENKRIVLCGVPWKGKAGTAPRYSAFHPELPYLFVDNEAETTVTSLRYDPAGKLEYICGVNSMPDDAPPLTSIVQTDIRLGKSGKYIYVLLRVVNAISVFALDADSGNIKRIQSIKVPSHNPRDCAMSPDGRFLLVCALEGNKVYSFPIGEDGKLSDPVFAADQPNPGSVIFFEA